MRNWLKVNDASRAAKAFWVGLLLDVDIAGFQAVVSEWNSAQAGNCK